MKLKTLGPNSLLILFGLLLALVTAEVGLRLVPNRLPPQVIVQLPRKWGPLRSVEIPQFWAEYQPLWESDPEVREHIKPGLDTVVHGHPEYPVWPIKTEALGSQVAGYRDTEPEAPPYAVVLGDSFGFGVGVTQEENWVTLLEQRLEMPIVNLSQVGASSFHEARIYERDGRSYQPAVVLWLFFQNDLKENLRFAQWLYPNRDIQTAGRVPSSFCHTFLHRHLDQVSVTYEWLLYVLRDCQHVGQTATPTYEDESLALTFCLDHDICDLGVQAQMLADGWAWTEPVIRAGLEAIEAEGSTAVFVIVPSKEQVYEPQYRSVHSLPAAYDIDRLTDPLRQLCRQEKLHCLDLTEPMREAATNGRQLYFPVDIHWNAAGNQVVAEIVNQYLHQEGLLP